MTPGNGTEGDTAREARALHDLPRVLFVCVHNAGRSQMAAAFLQHLGAGRVVAESAGSRPADALNPNVVDVMRERGIDLTASGARPKSLQDVDVSEADVVVTMGCGDRCPVFPGKRYLDWDLPDPAGRPLEEVREIRDEIERRVRALLKDLVG